MICLWLIPLVVNVMTTLSLSYASEAQIRHISYDAKDDYKKALCGKSENFPMARGYVLFTFTLHPDRFTICKNCIKCLSKKTQQKLVHVLVTKKVKKLGGDSL